MWKFLKFLWVLRKYWVTNKKCSSQWAPERLRSVQTGMWYLFRSIPEPSLNIICLNFKITVFCVRVEFGEHFCTVQNLGMTAHSFLQEDVRWARLAHCSGQVMGASHTQMPKLDPTTEGTSLWMGFLRLSFSFTSDSLQPGYREENTSHFQTFLCFFVI